jgi:hypothetical protein
MPDSSIIVVVEIERDRMTYLKVTLQEGLGEKEKQS